MEDQEAGLQQIRCLTAQLKEGASFPSFCRQKAQEDDSELEAGGCRSRLGLTFLGSSWVCPLLPLRARKGGGGRPGALCHDYSFFGLARILVQFRVGLSFAFAAGLLGCELPGLGAEPAVITTGTIRRERTFRFGGGGAAYLL